MSLYETLLDKMSGKEYIGYFAAFCPFDDHKSPALLVYEDGFFCMSCHKSGSLEYLAKKIKAAIPKLTQSQPKVLPRWREWERQYGDLQGIADYAHKSLLRNPLSYLKRRRINEFTEKGYFGYLGGWLVLPVFDSRHTICDCVVRAISHKGDSRYVLSSISLDTNNRQLYVPNWGRVEEARIIYVPFGIFDAWSFEAVGLPAVTGLTGKSISVERLRELHKKIILVPDLDEEEDAHKIANEFGMGARVKTLRYPNDCKDPDEIRIKYGNTALMNLLGV